MKLASKNRVGGMAVKAFPPSKIVTFLRKGGSVTTKSPRQTPWGDKLRTLLGGNTLICKGDVAMLAESVQHSCRRTKALVAYET